MYTLGVYEPNKHFDIGYRKRIDPNYGIEYSRKKQCWQLRGHHSVFATISDPNRVPIELIPVPWTIFVNTVIVKYEPQPAVSIMLMFFVIIF